jgi:RecJ-like exonuclease
MAPEGRTEMAYETGTCGKCSGTGHINAFSHIAGGVCFMCGGTGKVTLKAREQSWEHKWPVIPEADRATEKQWNYLLALTDHNDRKCCQLLHGAGAPAASEPYVTRKIMSAAIEAAKAS